MEIRNRRKTLEWLKIRELRNLLHGMRIKKIWILTSIWSLFDLLTTMYVDKVKYMKAFTITLDEDVFGSFVKVPLGREDMEYISQMKELSVTCIMLYMSQLYRVVKSANLGGKFFFVNPSAISGISKKGSQSALLASLLKDAQNDQLIFIPYNLGFHWVLFVIDLSYPIIYYLDSLHGKINQNQNLKLIFATAVKIRDNAKNMRRTVDWKEVQCPRQPMNIECGFYVMRFMKELIADPTNSMEKRYIPKPRLMKYELSG